MNLYKILGISTLSLATILSATSCKKSYLDTKPSTQVVLDDVFKTTQGARAVINGIHRSLYDENYHDKFGMASIGIVYECMAEDFALNNRGSGWFVSSERYNNSQNGDSYIWGLYYGVIANANFVLTNIDAASGTDDDKAEIKAQAYALRGWAYFQLIQTYQFAFGSPVYQVTPADPKAYLADIVSGASVNDALGVPIYLEPTKVGNPRASMVEVLSRMNADVDSSIHYFGLTTITRSDKSQINVNIAYGLKARMSLYQQKWSDAASYAAMARAGFSLMSSSDLLNGFNNVANSEWIWGSVINQEQNGVYASWMSHLDPRLGAYGATAQKVISTILVYSTGVVPYSRTIDSTDFRRYWWNPPIGPKWPGKEAYDRRCQFKFYSQGANSFLADYPLMRASEMYLIEAEGKAMSNDLPGALLTLEAYVQTRDPQYTSHTDLMASITGNKDRLVHEIWRQRRLELWGEGLRFFDAKRQMAINPSTGVVPLDNINRSWISQQVRGNDFTSVTATEPRLCFRIPGGEIQQNQGVYQNR